MLSQLWIFVLIGPPLGMVLMLGFRNSLVALTLSLFHPVLLMFLMAECYGLGLVPAVVTGLVWGMARRLDDRARIAVTVGVAAVLSIPFARFFSYWTWMFGGWVWAFGAVTALACCWLALRRERRAAPWFDVPERPWPLK